jgi:hypothetical protein
VFAKHAFLDFHELGHHAVLCSPSTGKQTLGDLMANSNLRLSHIRNVPREARVLDWMHTGSVLQKAMSTTYSLEVTMYMWC